MWMQTVTENGHKHTERQVVPEEEAVETVRVQLPRGSSPQQCTVISAQLLRPCDDVSARRRASSICRVPLGDVNDSCTRPRCDAPSVTSTCTCSRERTTALADELQPSVCSIKSADEPGPRLLRQTSTPTSTTDDRFHG